MLEGERGGVVSSLLLFVFQADAKSATEGTQAVSAGLKDHDHAVEMPSSPSSFGTRCPSMRVIDFAHACRYDVREMQGCAALILTMGARPRACFPLPQPSRHLNYGRP